MGLPAHLIDHEQDSRPCALSEEFERNRASAKNLVALRMANVAHANSEKQYSLKSDDVALVEHIISWWSREMALRR
jgi:CO dehydrogenase/acetyl-CoA synthase gamma subunit (corrinoid Fe-S protein)